MLLSFPVLLFGNFLLQKCLLWLLIMLVSQEVVGQYGNPLLLGLHFAVIIDDDSKVWSCKAPQIHGISASVLSTSNSSSDKIPVLDGSHWHCASYKRTSIFVCITFTRCYVILQGIQRSSESCSVLISKNYPRRLNLFKTSFDFAHTVPRILRYMAFATLRTYCIVSHQLLLVARD